jgi:hypothetical protein
MLPSPSTPPCKNNLRRPNLSIPFLENNGKHVPPNGTAIISGMAPLPSIKVSGNVNDGGTILLLHVTDDADDDDDNDDVDAPAVANND